MFNSTQAKMFSSAELGAVLSIKCRFLKALVLLPLCLFVQVPFAKAVTYYVSNSGSDANNGTSPETPWRSLTNVYQHQWDFQPGDSLLLKAGETFDGPLSMGKPGTATSPITIDRYGTGANPIIRGDHPNATWKVVAGFTGIYATPPLGRAGPINVSKVYDISGNKYWHLLRGTNDLNTWLGTFTNGCWGASTDGTIIYLRTLDDGVPPQMRLMDTKCVYVKDHYVVQNLELCYGGKGIQTAGEGTIIRNNHVHDVYATGIGLYTAWGCEVSSNLVERTGYTQIYVQYGGNNWVHHNVCRYTGIDRNFTGTIIASNCFVPIIENANIGIQQGTNNLIEWNTLSHSWSDFIDWYYESGTTVRYNYGYFSGMATAPYGNGIKMHHNIFHMGGHGSGISAFYGYDTNYCSGPDLGTNWIFNNLVYDYTTSGLYTRDNSPKVQFRNNILVSGFANKNLVNISPGTGSDYNIFWCKAGNPLGWVLGDTNVSPTLELWKARSGQDTHSIYADPQFVSADPVTAADFQLKKTSPCIDVGWDPQGTGFSPSAQGYQDYLGTRISQGLGPDIGAFEYKAAALTAPAAPPNLRIPNR